MSWFPDDHAERGAYVIEVEAAKTDWRAGRFAPVPGDEREFIPLPD